MPETVTLDVYARVSRLGDTRLRPTEGQVRDCEARIADRGARVGEILVDRGRSAWNPRAKRPRWDTLMKRLESGDTDGVCVFDLARFSRRPLEGERLIAAAERGLLILDSENEYDLLSASGRKAFRDQLSTAAYESDRLSTRVKRGKRLKAINGESNHSSRPFGFESDGWTHRPDEAAVLVELAGRLLAGDESQDAMILDLQARGIPTSYGKPWTRAGLRQVLVRPRNAGLVEYHGEIVARMPDDYRPVLDRDTWERVCAVYASRRRGRPISDTYLCSGIAVCGLCGHPLTGRPRNNMKPYPDGSVRRQYWCQPRVHGGGCGRIAIDQLALDRHVKALTVAILADPRHAAAVEAAARVSTDQRRTVEAEIAEIEHLAEELSARLGRREPGMTLARYDRAIQPLDRRLAELRAELATLDVSPVAPVPTAVVAASRRSWAARWAKATPQERRAYVRQALRGHRLVVGPADRRDRTNVAARVVIEE